jgi:hypothetical protein
MTLVIAEGRAVYCLIDSESAYLTVGLGVGFG